MGSAVEAATERRDGHVGPALAAQDDPLGGVQVGGGQVQLVVEHPEVVGAVGVGQHRVQVVLDGGGVVQARGQRLGQLQRQVHERHPPALADHRAGHAHHAQRQQRGAAREIGVAGAHQRAAVEVRERGGHLLVDHPHHLLGGHAVGHQAADERTGAGAHVDVELVDGAVHGQQVERAQGADLVDAAGETATAQHQGRAGALAAASPALAARLARLALRRLELDDLAHRRIIDHRTGTHRPG